MNWNDISTAPKDGEDILCYVEGYQMVLHWDDFEDDGHSWCPSVWGRSAGWNDFQNEVHFPTHWMPLPTPPEEEE